MILHRRMIGPLLVGHQDEDVRFFRLFHFKGEYLENVTFEFSRAYEL